MSAAWLYTAWDSEADDTARLAMLRLHISEVTAEIKNWKLGVAANSYSMSRGDVQNHLNALYQQRDQLKQSPTRATAGGRSLARIQRPR